METTLRSPAFEAKAMFRARDDDARDDDARDDEETARAIDGEPGRADPDEARA